MHVGTAACANAFARYANWPNVTPGLFSVRHELYFLIVSGLIRRALPDPKPVRDRVLRRLEMGCYTRFT